MDSLRTNLISFWKLQETSGNRADSVGTNTLVDQNTVLSASGLTGLDSGVGADFELSNSEHFTVADNASLDIAGNLSFSVWLKPESQPSGSAMIIHSKSTEAGNQRSWIFSYADTGGTKQFRVSISSDGSTYTVGNLTISQLSTVAFTHVAATYTASTGTVEVFINGSSAGTITSLPTSIHSGTGTFWVGVTDGSGSYFDGVMQAFGLWNKVLTSTEIGYLYNSGSGFTFPFAVASDTAGSPADSVDESLVIVPTDSAGSPSEDSEFKYSFSNVSKSQATYTNFDKS